MVCLTLSWRSLLSYRNQSIGLLRDLDWFLYDNDRRHERVKQTKFSLSTLVYFVRFDSLILGLSKVL